MSAQTYTRCMIRTWCCSIDKKLQHEKGGDGMVHGWRLRNNETNTKTYTHNQPTNTHHMLSLSLCLSLSLSLDDDDDDNKHGGTTTCSHQRRDIFAAAYDQYFCCSCS
mmetsp:Transcript_6932/g.17922  ORF Transcript_6932/g.17922 Transcript_6932/m.17922 type:complete len:108 (+) Transcript_6932:282-605(+)